MLEFIIKTIIADESLEYGGHYLYLFNESHNIILPIRIDQSAVTAILLAKENRALPRPSIYDTTTRVIKALNGSIQKVIVSKFEDDVFYSYIRLSQNGKIIDIDAKPSDAFSIALKNKVPICVVDQVVEIAGIKLTSEMLQISH